MKTKHLNHSTYKLQYHIVWGTKYRRGWLHVHVQIEIPPNIAISDAVQLLKGASSHIIRKKFKFIREMYLEKDGIWSVGYFVSSVGLNEATVKKYIEWQSRKEKPQTSRLF